MITVGVSLKAYFGYSQTIRWATAVSRAVAREENLTASGVRAFVLPSYPAIKEVREVLAGSGIAVGSQDASEHPPGPHTGEVSAPMLAELGCRYVAVGHAERRRDQGETMSRIRAKLAAVLAERLVPILCLGEETWTDPGTAAAGLAGELRQTLAGLDRGGEFVVAYEPVWAIGAAEPADNDHIMAVCRRLRETLRQEGYPSGQVIYGGSAQPGMLAQMAGGVDGLFLGRFAHDPAAFVAVLKEAATVNRRSATHKTGGIVVSDAEAGDAALGAAGQAP